MLGTIPRWLPGAAWLLLALATPAVAQSPPEITFSPAERTFYGANQQAEVRIRIHRMRSTTPECAGAKEIMLGYYAAGAKSGGINFWTGSRLRYNADGSYWMLPDGRFSGILGHTLEHGVAYERDRFMENQRLVAHEPLHVYFDAHPELTRGVTDMEAFIGRYDRRCGGG